MSSSSAMSASAERPPTTDRLAVFLDEGEGASVAAVDGGEAPSGRAFPLNSLESVPVESECFVGRMVFLHRPDPEPAEGDLSWPYASHFSSRKRRFEFRIQGRFKTDPGQVFFGVEVLKPVELSWTTSLTVNWILTVIAALSSAKGVSFSYNVDPTLQEDGTTLRQYLSYPMVAADTIIATPAGEEPPALSQTFTETPIAERSAIPMNTTDTYTFVYFSQYVDFVRWEICNMPFGWSSSIASFIGSQPVRFLSYSLDPGADSSAIHGRAALRTLLALTLVNDLPADVKKEAEPPPDISAA